MRVFLLLVAVGLAAAVQLNERVYTPDREYVYSYDTQVLSGVPHHGIQVSGIRIKCDVRVQFRTKTRALMQLDNLQVFSILGEMTAPWPEDGLMDSLLTPVDNTVLTTLTRELRKPVKFDYMAGKVENVKMDMTEALFSVNIKKAILSALKLNLNRENEITTNPKTLFDNTIPDWQEFTTGETTTAYRVMEDGISGTCESAYNVVPDVTNSETLRVTKVRNFDNCVAAPVYEQGLLSCLTIIPEAIHIQDMIQKSSIANYMLTGAKDGFVVQSVRIDSRYIITPMTAEDGNEVTSVIQIMSLKTAKASAGDIKPSDKMADRPNGILYEFPEMATTKSWNLNAEGDFAFAASNDNTEEKMAVIDRLVNEAVPAIHPLVTLPALGPIRRVAEMMRTMTVEELKTLATKYTADADLKKREIVLDLLPTLTTPQVIPVLAHLITENLISTTRAIISYQMAALTVTPTMETITLIAPMNTAFINHPAIIAKPAVYHTVLLNSATIVRRFVRIAEMRGATKRQIEAALDNNIKQAMALFKKTTTLSTQIVLVKAAGNSGLPALLPLFEQIIMNKAANPVLRKNAIAAAVVLPRVFRPMIQKMILPVYMDMTENREVREVAFISLIDTIPAPSILHMIVNTQRREKSLPVASLVYTYMCNVARMTLPGLETLAADVRRILPLVRAVKAPTEYWTFGTQNYYFDINCENKEMCMAMDMFKSSGDTDLTPSVVHARTYIYWLGSTFRAVEFDVWSSGVSTLMNKLIGVLTNVRAPLAGKSIPQMIEAILAPLKNFPVNLGVVADEIGTIIEKLGILERPVVENLNFGLVIKLLGNEITFLDITGETIRECVQTGNLPIIGNVRSFINEVRTSGLHIDMPIILHTGTSSMKIPTAAGVPLFSNLTGIAVSHLTGDITRARTANIGFHADIKASLATEVTGMMGIDFSVLATGIKYTSLGVTALPPIIDMDFNPATKKISLTLTPPTSATEVGRYDMYGTVFLCVHTSPDTTHTFKQLEIWHPERFEMINIKYRHNIPYTAVTIITDVHLPVVLPRWMPFSQIWPKHQAVWTVMSPEPWQITIQTCINDASGCAIAGSTFTADPTVPAPTILAAAITMGAKSRPDNNRARLAVNLAVGKDAWIHHFNVMAMFPGIMDAPFTTDMVINLRKISVFRKPVKVPASPTPNLALITMAIGTRKVTMTITPEDATAVNVKPFVNFAFATLMKTLIGDGVTVTKERAATVETPIVLKLVTEATNVDMNIIELSFPAVYGALYTLLDFPSMPHFEVNSPSAPITAVEAQFAIYPFLQKIICVARAPGRKEIVVDMPWFWVYRPAGALVSIEKPWTVPVHSTVAKPPLEKPIHNLPRSCSLSPVAGANADMMMTFDAAEFRVPALTTGCEVLLARDCTRAGLFTVLASGIGATKTVKILVHNHKVEITPVSSWMFSNDVRVAADGATVAVTEGTTSVLTETGAVSGENWGQVTKTGDWINVNLWNMGLIVSTDTKNVIVKAGPFYKGTLCGLCGNSNFDMMDDFMGPDMVVNPSAAEMILKYVLPSATCNIEDVRKTLGVTIAPTPRSCATVRRTGVVTYQGKTCFTMVPVNICPTGCTETGPMETVFTEVVCRNPNNDNTLRMVRESKLGVVDLQGKSPYATLQVKVPTACRQNA